MIFALDKRLIFPNPELAEDDGLLAVGGDLSIGRLLLAYQNGIFPWYSDETPILWYSPHERFVLFPAELKISKSMQQVLRSGKFRISFDEDFEGVIGNCSAIGRKDQDGTWITADMRAAYLNLHRAGHAHSVEVWQGDELVGGLYGVQVNQVFCGESMFSKASNASKAALIWLCTHKDFRLIDCQVHTEHLKSMGARMISREEYCGHLDF
ncbi:leucyl/phenylalanyl-tRNA--protein transferase [Mucilaginibacter yixingensis]|uniref:Leucyl/phenylalanyl-tRNA--protein transferase n=1 Tax=Mucilaginibacter yixingensis TaxID=1295612 RepID=A0A2T5J5E1_9SPHI|nr:leucyl/phenylalanyl-tRNA--protein transferase [Mucilaginibacter yixingensis]PTQ93208.1 leucyl/phenylalanyl-tRNA--protein transferase [Mucilaginibacter yixingensis]